MKTPALLAFLALASAAFAGFEVPKSIHSADDLDKALADAKAKNKPVTILYSNKETTCGLCSSASTQIIKELKPKSVMLYVEASDLSKLPEAARTAIRAEESGKFIPKTVIMNSDLTAPIAYVPYSSDDAAFQKSIREAERKMRGTGSASRATGSGSSFDDAFKRK